MSGLSQLQYFSPVSRLGKPLPSYHAGIGIDPDMPVSDSAKRLSGFIRPTAMEKFSASTISGAPMWIVTNPKNSLAYIYDINGRVYSVDANQTVTALNSGNPITSGSGAGAEYYDNYIYFASTTDVVAYGPLDGTPSFNMNYWTSTRGKSALTNTTYPSINGIQIPNHPMFRHPTSGVLFIGDVLSNTTANTNKGAIHQIKTTKTTVEGDTDNGSAYNALNLQFGYYPTAIEAYQDTLAIAAIEGTSTTMKQKRAALYFWDMTSQSFAKIIQVEFPDPLITAMKNVNGTLYVWSGNANGGVRLSRFVGGFSYEEVWFSEDGYPPFQGAVDAEMNRIVWGSPVTYPENAVCVFAMGSRAAKAGDGIHNILKTTSAGTNGMVTCLKYLQTTALNLRQPVVGWKDDSSQGLDKASTTYGTSVFRSEVYRIGQPFVIKKIRIPLAQAVTTGHAATVKIYVDESSTSYPLTSIDPTTYPNGNRNVVKYTSGDVVARGVHNFFLEIRWTGTSLLTVALPITIELETEQD